MGLADDLLEGVKEIASYTGFRERQVYHACASNQMPHFKIGSKICARKSEIDRAFSGAAQRS